MKLKDIRQNIKKSLDFSEQDKTKLSFSVSQEKESFRDISTEKSDIRLSSNDKLIVEETSAKNIDAVKKKGWLQNNIVLKVPKGKKLKAKKTISIKAKDRTKQLNDYNKRIGNVYFAIFLLCSVIMATFLYKDLMEKYLTYSYETLDQTRKEFPDHKKVTDNITEAKNAFLITEYLFKPISFIRTKSIDNAGHLIEGGNYLTSGLEKFSRIGFDLLFLVNDKEVDEILFSHFLDNSKENYLRSINDFFLAHKHYEQISDLGEDDLNEKLKFMKSQLENVLAKMSFIEKNYDTLLNILGHSERKKYLIVFQNSDEIRPQGGFMGSVGIVEMFGGRVESFEKKDIYALEWEVNKDPFREPAPEGLDKITGTFGLRDANYFVSSRMSSYKIKEILARADIEIDGILYTNIHLGKDLLGQMGGFESKILGKKITSDNFSLIMSSLVESKKLKEGTLGSPKDVLFDFMDELLVYLKEEDDYKKYMNVFLSAIQSRDVFFYAFGEKEEAFLAEMGIDGEINYDKSLDFNYPVFTSISGNKSDRYVERSYSKYVNVFDNCVVSTRLNIKLRHNFSLADERDAVNIFKSYDLNIEENLPIQGLGANKQFVRVVMPKDAIIKNENVKVLNYPNTRVVEFYMDTPRFESSYFVLNYLIPNKECNSYTYNFYKQAGIYDYNMDFTLKDESYKLSGNRKDFEYKLQ